MSSNYSIIIDKGERYEDYVRHIFRDIFSGPNSTFNRFIEMYKDDWDKVIEFIEVDLIRNDTKNYNNILAAKALSKTVLEFLH